MIRWNKEGKRCKIKMDFDGQANEIKEINLQKLILKGVYDDVLLENVKETEVQ